jgi:hypothetical protein
MEKYNEKLGIFDSGVFARGYLESDARQSSKLLGLK